MKLITEIENKYIKNDIPDFSSGDTIKVSVRVTEGSRERIQIFEGIVIAINFRGLSKHSPWFALIMLFVMLSMAGVPPFIGFYSKLFILQQVVSAGYIYLAVAAVVFAVISAYYYLQIIKTMYFDDAEKEFSVTAPLDMRIILSINGTLILVIGLMPSYWMELAISLF